MKNNKGSITVEAAIIIPIFIFAMLFIYITIESIRTKTFVYEGFAETADVLAQETYIQNGNVVLANYYLQEKIDNNYLVEKRVENGIKGISFSGSNFLTSDGHLELNIKYQIKFELPFLGDFNVKIKEKIKQKAYIGKKNNKILQGEDVVDMYVFVAENKSVYHSSRTCSHLLLSISSSNIQQAKENGYKSCDICKNFNKESVFITQDGKKYHSEISCSGLKRTVYRKKLSEVSGLGGCSRCVK